MSQAAPNEHEFDVCIVGAGMVGLALAAALAESNLRIAIIDRNIIPPKDSWQGHDPRVSAIIKSSEHFLSNIHAWQHIPSDAKAAFSAMHVWEQNGTAALHFNSAEVYHAELGYLIENRQLQWALFQSLQAHSNVHWFLGEAIQGITKTEPKSGQAQTNNWQLELNQNGTDQSLHTQLLIGADGALSYVREQLGIQAPEQNLNHQAIVCQLECELPHNNCARQIFLPSGPLAFLPLANNAHTCSIVWSAEPERAEALMAMDETEFNTAIAQAFEHTLGSVRTSEQRYSFPLYQRHAEHYVANNAALIGDAAHTIHPLAGQGVNLGFMDAAVLAEELINALTHNKNISSPPVLERYQNRRRKHVAIMMHSIRGFQKIYGSNNADLIALRNIGVKWLNKLGPVKNHVLKRAMGLEGDVPELAREK